MRRSLQLAYGGDADDLLERSARYVERGFTELIVYVTAGNAEADSEAATAQLLPRLRRTRVEPSLQSAAAGD